MRTIRAVVGKGLIVVGGLAGGVVLALWLIPIFDTRVPPAPSWQLGWAAAVCFGVSVATLRRALNGVSD